MRPLPVTSRRDRQFEGETELSSGRPVTVGWTEVDAGTPDFSVDVDYVRDVATRQTVDLCLASAEVEMDAVVDEILRGKITPRPGHT